MEQPHVVLIDKIVIKFTASLKKKWLKSFQTLAENLGGGNEGIEFQQKTCQIFFPALIIQHSPTTQYLIRY